MPADYWVTVSCHRLRISVRALMAADAPTITDGYGGFNEVERPGRRSLVTWTGQGPLRMSLPLMLDGWKDRGSVEQAARNVERMAQMGNAFQAPPKVRVSGRAVPHSALDWRIAGLEWGPALRTSAGIRRRQEVTLTLVQAIDEGAGIRVSAVANRRASGRSVALPPPGGREAFQRLAAAELGEAKRWKEIARLNDVRTPNSVKAGRVLRLP